MLIPSDTPSGLLWVGVAKTTLFRGLLHINAVRVLVVEHLMGGSSFSWNCSVAMLQCVYLLYLPFSLEGFERLHLSVNHSSSTSALASRGQNCPRHGFLGCQDHHCLFYMWFWTSTWASDPIRKMNVYHWLYDPTIAPQYFAFRLLKRKEGFWYPRPTMFIINPFYPNSQIPFYLLKARS